VKIEFRLPCGRNVGPRTFTTEPETEPSGEAPRLARLLALAHRLEGLVQSGEVNSYGDLAQLGEVSPARISQIMILLNLAPAIQEQVLFLSLTSSRILTELALRKIAREPLWDRQQKLFEHLLKN
jgi:hypothetical protein